MPRETLPLVRIGGFIEPEKFYILSYEGTQSEPKYFEDLRKSDLFNNSGKIEVIPLKRPKSQGSSPKVVKKLLKEAKDTFNFRLTDEFWLIIDRDHWETIHKLNFDDLINECNKEANFFVALSNPCFEIWLILHLKSLDEFTEEEKDKLFKNKKINKSKNYIDEVLADCINNGRGYNKTPDPRVFLPKISTAISNAKAIAVESEAYPHYLGSDVYKLIGKLIK